MDIIFKCYHKSTKQTAELKESFEALGQKAVTFTRVGGTRWVGHTQLAVRNILTAYPALIKHLTATSRKNTQSAVPFKCKFLLSKLRSQSIIMFLHFLLDLLGILVKLSMVLQQRETCVYTVHEQLKSTMTYLKKLESRYNFKKNLLS